jgi:hypothetical protein
MCCFCFPKGYRRPLHYSGFPVLMGYKALQQPWLLLYCYPLRWCLENRFNFNYMLLSSFLKKILSSRYDCASYGEFNKRNRTRDRDSCFVSSDSLKKHVEPSIQMGSHPLMSGCLFRNSQAEIRDDCAPLASVWADCTWIALDLTWYLLPWISTALLCMRNPHSLVVLISEQVATSYISLCCSPSPFTTIDKKPFNSALFLSPLSTLRICASSEHLKTPFTRCSPVSQKRRRNIVCGSASL